MKKPYHVVSFSGGKDSTGILLRILELGMPIDEVVNVDTGMEFPEMYRHIAKVRIAATTVTTGKACTSCLSEFLAGAVPCNHWKN